MEYIQNTNETNQSSLLQLSTKEKLAISAFELVASKGSQGVNLDMIAANAGVTKGSLYFHYESKKELLLEACNYYYQNWMNQMSMVDSIDTDPVNKLRRFLLLVTEQCFFDEKNRLFTSEIFICACKDADFRKSWTDFYERVCLFCMELIEGAVANSATKITSSRLNAELILSIIEGIKQKAIFSPSFMQASQIGIIVDRLMQIVMI